MKVGAWISLLAFGFVVLYYYFTRFSLAALPPPMVVSLRTSIDKDPYLQAEEEEMNTTQHEPVIQLQNRTHGHRDKYFVIETKKNWYSYVVKNVRLLREPKGGEEKFLWDDNKDEQFFPFLDPSNGIPPGVRILPNTPENAAMQHDVNLGEPIHIPRAIVVYMLACVNNYHHAWSDTFIPYYHRALSRGVFGTLNPSHRYDKLPLVLLVPTGTNRWGLNNRACPELNRYPYGSDRQTFWMMTALQNLSTGVFPPYYVQERAQGYNKKHLRDPRPLNLVIDELIIGGDYTCFENTLPISLQFPHFSYDIHVCNQLRDIMTDMLLRALDAQERQRRRMAGLERYRGRTLYRTHHDRVTAEEIACPHVVILSRSGRVRNARLIVNHNDVVRAITMAMPECATITEVRFEKMTIREQFECLFAATIFVAPRGAASTYQMFQRPGAVLVSAVPMNFRVPATRENCNTPYRSFTFQSPKTIVHDLLCRVVIPCRNGKEFGNNCDMYCPPNFVLHSMRKLLVDLQRYSREGVTEYPLLLPLHHVVKGRGGHDQVYYTD
eukprot:PhF_6_TR10372/c0_g1_i3/m.16136